MHTMLGYPPCTMWPAKLPSDELVTSFTVRMNSPSAGGLALGRWLCFGVL